MRIGSASVLLLIPALTASLAHSQAPTVYEPTADDPRIVAVMDAERRMAEALEPFDRAAMERVLAPDLIVHSPINRVVDRANVLARMQSGEIAYEPDVERHIEFVGVRGDSVVVMGEEVLRPRASAPNAGKLVHRRFSDIWRNVDGAWKLAIRQATITSAE